MTGGHAPIVVTTVDGRRLTRGRVAEMIAARFGVDPLPRTRCVPPMVLPTGPRVPRSAVPE